MANVLYGKFIENMGKGDIDFDTATVKLALVTSSYTPDEDAHNDFADITNEVVGTGYTAGGETVANLSWAVVAGSNVVKLDFDDVVWSSSSITARGAVLYIDTGTAATSLLIGYDDFGADKTSDGDTFTYTVNASGFLTLSYTQA